MELLSAYGVVDVGLHPPDVVCVFIRCGLTPAQKRMLRELAIEWWNVPRVVVTIGSTTTMRVVSRQPTAA